MILQSRVVLSLVIATFLTGCASYEGFSFAPTRITTIPINKAGNSNRPAQILIIGETTALRVFKNEQYVELREEIASHVGSSDNSLEDLQSTYLGFAGLHVADYIVASITYYALVPRKLDEVGFASKIGTHFGSTGDLVVARTNSDGFLTIDRVLCGRDADFHSCNSRYRKGVYDANSGTQLNFTFGSKTNGIGIDVATYTTKQ